MSCIGRVTQHRVAPRRMPTGAQASALCTIACRGPSGTSACTACPTCLSLQRRLTQKVSEIRCLHTSQIPGVSHAPDQVLRTKGPQMRNYVLALWRADVSQRLSLDQATTNLRPRLVPYARAAWKFLNAVGFINWGLAGPVKERCAKPAKKARIIVVGAGLAGVPPVTGRAKTLELAVPSRPGMQGSLRLALGLQVCLCAAPSTGCAKQAKKVQVVVVDAGVAGVSLCCTFN